MIDRLRAIWWCWSNKVCRKHGVPKRIYMFGSGCPFCQAEEEEKWKLWKENRARIAKSMAARSRGEL